MDMIEKIKRYREKHGLSQERLGRMLYVTGTTVYNWEKGNCKPSQMAQEIMKEKGIL